MSPADLRRRNSNPKTTLIPTCLSLRNNAACCIPLRDQCNLRENNHARVLNLLAQMKPQCLPQISQIYADKTPKQQNSLNFKQTVFLCEIMQQAAFLCVICAICGRIITQEYSIETPKSPADLADLRRQTPKQQNCLNFKQPVFLCEIIQLSCIPLRNLRYLRENKHARVLKQSPNNPQ